MEINYWAVLVCAVISMIVGFVWYGLIFKNVWIRIIKATPDDLAKREAMQKSAGPLYLVQFLLTILQLYILAHYIAGWTDATGVENSLWIWLGFIVPTIAGSSMWNNDSAKVSWARFGIQAGYQLVMFVIYGLILGMWR